MTLVTLNERKAFTSGYLATPATVGIARNAARSVGWGLAGVMADDIGLVVSELVTNSMTAATHTEIRVTLAEHVAGHVTVEVWDSSPDLPERKISSLTDPGGRGLWIVEEPAVHCGSRREGDGKVVFAVL